MEHCGINSELWIVKHGGFLSFTIIHADGYWLGKFENTLILEVCFESEFGQSIDPQHQINTFCYNYKKEFNQDTILVTKEEINMEYV